MPTYYRFEDLPVWQAAVDPAAQIFSWTAHRSFRGKGDLANQFQRATLSISNNIAEGFERGSTKELLQFLYIARGSAGEARSMLCVMDRMSEFDEIRAEIDCFQSRFENVSRQLGSWTQSLQNSDIKGQRHFNNQARQQQDRQIKRNEFFERQARFREEMEQKLKRDLEDRQQKRDL